MIIPNDKGHPWRLYKYVEYNSAVPPIGPATYLAWAKREGLSPDDCVTLAWYNSMSYCELTAVYLLYRFPIESIQSRTHIQEFWDTNKQHLVFESARRYVKIMDWFVPLLSQYMQATRRKPFEWLQQVAGAGTSHERYDRVYRELSRWRFMGRFSVELFTDAIVQMSRDGLLGDLWFLAKDFDWKDGSNITTGVLNVFYQDEAADQYDKNKFLSPKTQAQLPVYLQRIQQAIKRTYPDQDSSISVITPKLCSFRNLFKGRRYGGYHHDRQLGQLYRYQQTFPNDPLWSQLLLLRKQIFIPSLLGEIGGWSGIRKERTKLWITEGRTGVEG